MKNDSLKITITIPSYWSRASGKGLNKDDAIYDHPTPLDCEGTLKRTLDSVDVLKNKNFNLVVMGTQGATGAKEIFLATHTVHVIRKSKIPILVVPVGYEFKKIKSIIFPTDYGQLYREKDIKLLINLATTHNAK